MKLKQNKLFGINLEDFKIDKKIEERIKEEEEVLVFGSSDGVYAYDGKKVKKIAERDGWVYALTVYNNELYDGGSYRKIYRTLRNEIVAERDGSVLALTVYNNELYDGGTHGKIYRTLDNKVVAERDDWVYALAVYKGELYDGGDYGLYNTFTNKMITNLLVTCMISVPRSVIRWKL
jgi:hypothetical protein